MDQTWSKVNSDFASQYGPSSAATKHDLYQEAYSFVQPPSSDKSKPTRQSPPGRRHSKSQVAGGEYVERLAKSIAAHAFPLGGAAEESDQPRFLVEDEELAELLWKDIFAAVSVTEMLHYKAKERQSLSGKEDL